MNKLFVVGIGPGEASQMTGKALDALRASDVIAGYGVYVDLVKPLFPDKEYLTVKELADYLGLSKQSIYRNWHDHFNTTIRGFTKVRIASVLAE